MVRFLLGLFLVLHGLVHGLYVGHARGLFELRPGMVWPDGSWILSRFLGVPATRWLAGLTYLLAGLGFVAGGLGLLIGQAWWRPVTVAAASFSAVVVLLFWNGRFQNLADQGLVALLINLALLVAILALNWPTLNL